MSFGFPLKGFTIPGSENSDLLIGFIGDDFIDGKGGDDLLLGLLGNDQIYGGDGADLLAGGWGNDMLVGNKGDDFVFGGAGYDLLVWNNGDGSDLMNGGTGYDKVQVNFNTDLVNDDLQNKDVAEFSVTPYGVQFARVELNDQAVNGLFQLDIRETEELETNFGGGDDAAKLIGTVLEEIKLTLDGGEGIDLLDLSQLASGQSVDLHKGKAGSAHVTNFENVLGTAFDDEIIGDKYANVISGGDGMDTIKGKGGSDTLVGNKGNDFVFGGSGDDLLVWNNGDGSDLLNGGRDYDKVQVNFDTDLVNDDLQNKDVAEFSVTSRGVQFARVELNDQAVNGLFQLDIRNTEKLETNFGGGDDAAQIVGTVLHKIKLDLDGGDGIDVLDFSQAGKAVEVDLAAGTAGTAVITGFENVIGSDFSDVIIGDDGNNVIEAKSGNDILTGKGGADIFVFNQSDTGVKVITDFELGVDALKFQTTAELSAQDLLASLVQDGEDVTLEISGKEIVIENTDVNSFATEDFMFA
ncbi:MAG: iron-regulated protein frpC [Mangrovicoccus sp.]|nr:iron-regulated protein frpC [Mangrovicoccus sp.]